MKTTLLTMDDISLIVRRVGIDRLMDELIERLELVFRRYQAQEMNIPARSGFFYSQPEEGLLEWMPVMKNGVQATIKVVGYHPANPDRRGLPTILSTISSYDVCSGSLVALADCTFLTALRTGAASAVASRLMARADSEVLGLIGAGAQSVTQLHALSRAFPLKKAVVYDTNPAASRSLARRTAFTGIEIEPVNLDELPGLLAAADILCTCTSVEVGHGPVFPDSEFKPWLHINAVGSDFPGKFEVPLSVLKRSFVCPDFPEQAQREGECQRLRQDEIGPSLVELSQNPHHYPGLGERLTVFDSTGWALEDQAALDLTLDYAREMRLGTQVALEYLPHDPRNPYEFIVDDSPTVS
jgi:ornithine cyclodeaminase/alanine dehydrogenase-like protein (mu-crystallin family)